MTTKRRLLATLGFAAWAAAPAAAADWTLKDVYAKSLANSERVAISAESVRQAESLYRETFGSAMPRLFYRHTTTWQDTSGAGEGTLSSFTQSPQNEGAFRLQKLGLTGYRELAALRAGGSVVAQRKWDRLRVEQLLLQDVAAAFFGTLEAEETAASTKKLIELAEDRGKELRERVRVGRSREAESLESEYQIAQLKVQLEESGRALENRLSVVGFLAGETAPGLSAPDVVSGVEVPALDGYLARLDSRPDVRSAQEAVDVALGAVKVARADYFPGADIGAAYYTNRTGFRKAIDWDATLGLEIPIFSWGATRAAARNAGASLAQSRLAHRAVRRQAELEVRNAHRDLVSAHRQLALQQAALKFARRDYEVQARDDRRGLVTPLEVLESMNRLNAAELALNRARLQVRLASLNLEIAAGVTPQEVLK